MRFFVWLFTWLLLGQLGIAAPKALLLDTVPSGQPLGKYMEFYLDKGAQLDFAQFRAQATDLNFVESKADYPTFGYLPKDAYWVRFVIENPSQEDKHVIISNRAVALDELTLAHLGRDGQWEEQTQGDHVRFADRPVHSRIPAFPFTLHPGLNIFEARMKSFSSVQLPLQVWEPQKFYEFESRENLIMGLVMGCALSMLFYNLFVAIRFQNKTYYVYIAYIFAFGLHTLIYYGLLGYSFFPQVDRNWFTAHGSFFAIDLAAIFAGLFSAFFLRLNIFYPRVYKALLLLVSAMTLNLGLAILGVAASVKITMLLNFILSVSLILIGIMQLKNLSYARYYTVAWTSLLGGNLILIFANSGLINHSVVSFWSQAIGASAELIFLSFALADRFAAMNQERVLAIQKQKELQENLISTQNLLRNEVESKLMLASEVAHRLNNPLNYIQQAIETIKLDLGKLHSVTNSILEDNVGEDPTVKALQHHLESLFADIDPAIKQLELGLNKSTKSVTEIRAISGVDGQKLQACSLKELGEFMERRLQDNFTSSETISLDALPVGDCIAYVNPYLIQNLLEKLLHDAFHSARGPIRFSMKELRDAGKLLWVVSIKGAFDVQDKTLFADKERMQHILHSSSTLLQIDVSTEAATIKLWPCEDAPQEAASV